MSGGFFDYKNYVIDEFADAVELEIQRAQAPRPEKVPCKFVTIWSLSEADPSSACRTYVSHPPFPSAHAAKKWLEDMERIPLQETGHPGVYTCLGRVYQIKESVSMEYPDGVDRPEWGEDTLSLMREGVKALRVASVYAHRIDYLLSGDDGEETFAQCLRSELEGAAGAD